MKFLSSLLLSLSILLGSSALRAQDAPAVDNPEPEQLAEIFPSLYSPVISDLSVLSNPREHITKLDYNVAHPGHLYAYVETEAVPGEPPQNVGAWHTVAGLYKGFTPVAIKVDSSGDLVTGADPGGAVTSCTACIVVGGLNGFTPVALNVGSDGTVITSGGGGGGTVFPVTVSGTVNSGGIPCFTNATTESSSAAITANVLIKGGGAGACAAASSITDDGVHVTTAAQLQAGQICASSVACWAGVSGTFQAQNQPGSNFVPIKVGPTVTIADTGPFGATVVSGLTPCETAFATTSVNTGSATTTTGQTCVPANAMIFDVIYHITTTITTATSFTVGISGSVSKFCSTQSTLTAGTVGHCTLQVNAGAAESGVSPVAVVVTFNGTPGAGAIRLEVASIAATTPTS